MIHYLLCFLLLSTKIFAANILVTGGAGFIGSHTAEQLAKNGHRVIIVDHLQDKNPAYVKMKKYHLELLLNTYPDSIKFYEEDITHQESLEQIIFDEKPHKIVHLAASVGVRHSIEDPTSYLNNNIIGTLHILELAQKYKMEQVVLASSSSVYGECEQGPFSEDQRVETQSSQYAVSKKSLELLAYTYHHLYKLPCTCLRFFTVYGPWGRLDMAPFIFLNALHQGNALTIFGDGSAIRDFTYVDDIVQGILLALDTPFDYEIFNIGCGEPIVLNEFISTLETVTETKAKINYTSGFAGDVSKTHADISKAKKMLGYQPQISLEKGMEKMNAWYQRVYSPFSQQESTTS